MAPSNLFPNGYCGTLNFGFFAPENNKYATTICRIRACILFITVIGLIPPLAGRPKPYAYKDFPGWINLGSNSELPYVCQLRTPACPSGWSGGTGGDRCFKRVDDKVTWNAAERSCRTMGGTLPTIRSATENGDVLEACAESQPCWIGLYRNITGGFYNGWAWDDGTAVTVTSFNVWQDGFPNTDVSANAAAIGFLSVAAAAQKVGIFIGTIASLIAVLICLFVFCLIGIFYWNGATGKSPGCLSCAGCGDGCCSCLTCLSVISSIVGAAGGVAVGARVGSAIISIILLFLLIAVTVMTCRLTGKLQAEMVSLAATPGAAVQMPVSMPGAVMVVGTPVIGQPMGQPVGQYAPSMPASVVSPASASNRGGPTPIMAQAVAGPSAAKGSEQVVV